MRFFAIFLVIIILAGVVGFVPVLRQQVLNISFYIKSFYDAKKESASLFIDNYTNQAERIKQMRETLKTLEQESIKYEALKAEYDNLHYSLGIERHYIDPDVHLVKVLSYATLGIYTKIWIDYNEPKNEKKIYGLIKDGYAIGIAKWVGNSLQGILNGDMDCGYSVYVGENRVPGILRATQGGIAVDYIPAWQSVKSGDVVRTSGLDGIFFEGVQVGILGNVKYENGYLKAEITPYNFSNRLSYVWLVDTKIEQSLMLQETLIDQDSEQK